MFEEETSIRQLAYTIMQTLKKYNILERDCQGPFSRVGRTRVAWGKILMQRSNPQDAREHFDKAATQFGASGLTRESEEAHKLIEATASAGEHPPTRKQG
jgi:hypothetical protein